MTNGGRRAYDECRVLINPEEDPFVYKCTACDAVYHEECGKKMVSKSRRCAYCGKLVEIGE